MIVHSQRSCLKTTLGRFALWRSRLGGGVVTGDVLAAWSLRFGHDGVDGNEPSCHIPGVSLITGESE